MTCRIKVTGVVQGVGFRPATARLAQTLELCGTVRNAGGTVDIVVQGEPDRIRFFLSRLESEPPKGAQILEIKTEQIQAGTLKGFLILPSDGSVGEVPILPPDLPTCETCLKELYDKGNRRFQYPFISCISCGPRYSIMEQIPYDRETTTMKDFALCQACVAEYKTDSRRRHAQTISCHSCGPQLLFCSDGTEVSGETAFSQAVEKLRSGGVIAVKGIGGYQFVCRPDDEKAVRKLRRIKGREHKPFAVMFPELKAIKQQCQVSGKEETMLHSPARPIVLLEKKRESFCRKVDSGSRFLGAFLPYTPLHHMLLDTCGPLVVTSGNVSSQPIVVRDEQMLLPQFADLDGILYHKRRIVTPLDDSVVRIVAEGTQFLRRSRGYVPLPLFLKTASKKTILAMGGDLKAGFCLMTGERAYLSQYLGDMEQQAVQELYRETAAHMQKLLHIKPEVVVCDLHPAYHSTRLAEEMTKEKALPLMQVQHHHAHAASVMAEHQLDSCIGVIFDGTGYGTDGSVWGGEFLLCRGPWYRRAGNLEPVALCGGDAVSADASIAAMSYLYAAGLNSNGEQFSLIRAALENGIQTVESSSIGRLFDAVSFLLGFGRENHYEGECAIALENAAAHAQKCGKQNISLRFPVRKTEDRWTMLGSEVVRQIVQNVDEKKDHEMIAWAFHEALAHAVSELCTNIRNETGENKVALSGGVFSNGILTERCVKLLKENSFQVYLNREVPAGDGGICLGQAWLAAQAEPDS